MSFLDVQRRLRRRATSYGVNNAVRGTLITGEPGSGKSFLLQRLALDALREQQDGHLVYIGTRGKTELLLAEGFIGGLFKNAARDGYQDRSVFEGDNVFAACYSNAWMTEGKSVACATMLRALPERGKYILAIDDLQTFFTSRAERADLLAMIKKLLDSPSPHLTFITTFHHLLQIENAFGTDGFSLFARFNEKFFLRNHASEDARARNIGIDFGGVAQLSDLRKGEAVRILDGRSEVVTFGMNEQGEATERQGVRRVWCGRRYSLRRAQRSRIKSCQVSQTTSHLG